MQQSPEEIAEYLAERRRKFPRRKSDEGTESAHGNVADRTTGIIHENNIRGNRKGKFGQFITK